MKLFGFFHSPLKGFQGRNNLCLDFKLGRGKSEGETGVAGGNLKEDGRRNQGGYRRNQWKTGGIKGAIGGEGKG